MLEVGFAAAGELLFVKCLNGSINFIEQLDAYSCDATVHLTPIFLPALAINPTGFLQTVQEAGGVGCGCDHPFSNLVTPKTFRASAPKNAQDIILRLGDAKRLEELVRTVGKLGTGTHEAEVGFFLNRRERPGLFDLFGERRWSRFWHIASCDDAPVALHLLA